MGKGDDALYGDIAGDKGHPLDLENRCALFELQQGGDVGRGGGPDPLVSSVDLLPRDLIEQFGERDDGVVRLLELGDLARSP